MSSAAGVAQGPEYWQTAALTSVNTLWVVVGVYALAVSVYRARRRAGTPEDFIAAKGSVGVWRLAGSFYAGAMGGWVVTTSIYASYAGLLGNTMYAVSVGAPVVLIAYAGGVARRLYPESTSLPNFLLRRFSAQADAPVDESGATEAQHGFTPASWSGKGISSLAALVTLFNMSICLLAEYSTIGTLFRSFVGLNGWASSWPMILLAVVTIIYTVAGGLYVSILTDVIQAIGAIVLVIVMVGFLCAENWKNDAFPELSEDQKGFNLGGFSSICTMPLSLLSATFYSDAVWQRIWASENDRALRRGAWLGAVFIIAVVWFFGFIGWLALWTGRATFDMDPNVYFFAVFSRNPRAQLDSVPGILALICGALMSEGAVDSLQNGMTATLSSTLLKGRPLWATRAVVLFVNIPLAILGASPLVNDVLMLFLITNLVCLSCIFPLFLSLIPGPTARHYVTEGAVLLGCVCGAFGLSVYGCAVAGSVKEGMYLAWLGNMYGYSYFLVCLGSSVIGTTCGILATLASRRLWQRAAGLRRGREEVPSAATTTPPVEPEGVKPSTQLPNGEGSVAGTAI